MTRIHEIGLPQPEPPSNGSGDDYVRSKCGVRTTLDNVFSRYKFNRYLYPVCLEKHRVYAYLLSNVYLLCFGVRCVNTPNSQWIGWVVLNILVLRLMLPLFIICMPCPLIRPSCWVMP